MEKLESENKFERQFTIKHEIGSGTFGTVSKCIRKSDSRMYAVKMISNVNMMNIDSIQEEASIMENADSDFSLDLVDHFYDEENKSYIMVMPYCKSGSLENKMEDTWSRDSLLLFLYQIAQGFIDISKKGIMHLDLKPDNILVRGFEEYLICDFGCSRIIQDLAVSKNFLKMTQSKGLGTAEYVAPEVERDLAANKKSDIWSLGVILYKLIYKKTPFSKKSTGMSFGVYKTTYEGHDPSIDPVVQILKKMLSEKSKERPQWSQVRRRVYQIQGLSEQTVIVSSTAKYLQYIKDFCIVGTFLVTSLQNIQKISQHTQTRNNAIKFMAIMIELMEGLTKKGFSCSKDFYLFPQTLATVSSDQSNEVSSIAKQISELKSSLMKQHQKMYVVLQKLEQFDAKKLLFQQAQVWIKKFSEDAELKEITAKNQFQWFKLMKILNVVSETNLAYEKKRVLRSLSEYIVCA